MDRDDAETLVRWARMQLFEGKSRAAIEAELDEKGIYDDLRSKLLDHAEESVARVKAGRGALLRDGTTTQIVVGILLVILAIILFYFAWPDHGRGRGVIVSVLILGLFAIGNAIYWRIQANNQ